MRFLLSKLNIASFYNAKISVKHATNSTRSEMCIIACDVTTFAKSLWSAAQ